MQNYLDFKRGDEIAIIGRDRKIRKSGKIKEIKKEKYGAYVLEFEDRTKFKVTLWYKKPDFIIVNKKAYEEYIETNLLRDFSDVLNVDIKVEAKNLSAEKRVQIIEHLKSIRDIIGETPDNEGLQKMHGNHAYNLKDIKNNLFEELLDEFRLLDKMKEKIDHFE